MTLRGCVTKVTFHSPAPPIPNHSKLPRHSKICQDQNISLVQRPIPSSTKELSESFINIGNIYSHWLDVVQTVKTISAEKVWTPWWSEGGNESLIYMSMKLSFALATTNVLHPSKEKTKKKENYVGSIDSAVAMWFSHHKVAKIVCKVSYAGLSPQLSAALLLSLLYFSSPSTLQNTNFCYCEKKTHESRFSSTTSTTTCHLKLSAYLPLL